MYDSSSKEREPQFSSSLPEAYIVRPRTIDAAEHNLAQAAMTMLADVQRRTEVQTVDTQDFYKGSYIPPQAS